MNLTYFRPKIKRECGKQKQQPRQRQICRHNIRHQKFIWEYHMWCHVKISEVPTLVSMIPNFWCSLEVAATELQLCFVIKRNVWWKRTFLPTVTIVVLHHKHMKLFKPLHHMLLRVPSENVSISRFVERKNRKRDCSVYLEQCRNL